MTEEQRARAEHEIWCAFPATKQADPVHDGADAAVWLRKRFGGPAKDYHLRAQLLAAGVAANPLWEAIRSGQLSLVEAHHVLGRATTEAAQPEEVSLFIPLALEEYVASRPVPTPVPPAVAHRQHELRVQAGKKGAEARRTKYGTAQPLTTATRKRLSAAKTPEKRRARRGSDEATKAFRLRIFDAVRPLIGELTTRADLDPHFVERARVDFEEWLDTAVTNFLHDLRRAREEAARGKLDRIGRVRFAQACEMLGIFKIAGKPVVFGRQLDEESALAFAKLVRERQHKVSRKLHPDRMSRQPTEPERAEFQAVQEARDILDDYIRQMTESKG